MNLNLQEAKKQGLFPKLSIEQLAGVTVILECCEKYGVILKAQVAYIMATAWHESYLLPITEKGSQAYLKSKKYYPYIGRGYVQLTWKHNYEKQGKRLNAPLVSNPELALDKKIAGDILVYGMKHGEFTGKKLSDYINNVSKDYLNARRIINGTDRAKDIAIYAEKFEKCL